VQKIIQAYERFEEHMEEEAKDATQQVEGD
jgi:hypothetical protein